MSVKQKLFELVAEHFSISSVTLSDNTVAGDVIGWDSLAHAELLLKIENEFQIEFNLMDMMNMNSLGELKELVNAKI